MDILHEVKFRSVVVYQHGKESEGHYFYNATSDSDYGHIYGVKDLTLSKAIGILKAKGLDPIPNIKLNIAVYYLL